MYGDAADVYPDDDRDGKMDDLNHDGKVDEADAQIVFRAAEEVEKRFPVLVGGVAVYRATSAHGPFVHIDCRGSGPAGASDTESESSGRRALS